MTPSDEEVVVAAGGVRLRGDLSVPEHPARIVVFPHGSGSAARDGFGAHLSSPPPPVG